MVDIKEIKKPNDGASQVNTFRIAEITGIFGSHVEKSLFPSRLTLACSFLELNVGGEGVNSELQWPAKEGRAGAS